MHGQERVYKDRIVRTALNLCYIPVIDHIPFEEIGSSEMIRRKECTNY